MTGVDFLLMLVVAAVIGAIGGAVGGYSSGGCLTSIAAGFIGAFIGRILRDILGLPTFWVIHVGNTRFPIIWSIIGAAIFVALLRAIRRRGAI